MTMISQPSEKCYIFINLDRRDENRVNDEDECVEEFL
jgi:hypothetical protein